MSSGGVPSAAATVGVSLSLFLSCRRLRLICMANLIWPQSSSQCCGQHGSRGHSAARRAPPPAIHEQEVGVADTLQLEPLTEEAFVANLQQRFKRDLIYVRHYSSILSFIMRFLNKPIKSLIIHLTIFSLNF